MTKDHIRCFFALTVSEKIQNDLAVIQNQLKTDGAQARWIKPHNIHLTLRFLGERSEKRVRETAGHLSEWFHGTSGFPITIDRLECFPNNIRPRVIGAGISNGTKEAAAVFEHLNAGLAKIGIPKDREDFVPHLTLGRCKTSEESRSTAEAIQKAPMFSIEASAESVSFFQSTLHSDGSIYTPIARIPLNLYP